MFRIKISISESSDFESFCVNILSHAVLTFVIATEICCSNLPARVEALGSMLESVLKHSPILERCSG